MAVVEFSFPQKERKILNDIDDTDFNDSYDMDDIDDSSDEEGSDNDTKKSAGPSLDQNL